MRAKFKLLRPQHSFGQQNVEFQGCVLSDHWLINPFHDLELLCPYEGFCNDSKKCKSNGFLGSFTRAILTMALKFGNRDRTRLKFPDTHGEKTAIFGCFRL